MLHVSTNIACIRFDVGSRRVSGVRTQQNYVILEKLLAQLDRDVMYTYLPATPNIKPENTIFSLKGWVTAQDKIIRSDFNFRASYLIRSLGMVPNPMWSRFHWSLPFPWTLVFSLNVGVDRSSSVLYAFTPIVSCCPRLAYQQGSFYKST